jgi:signal transduction histidine kinase
MESIYRVTSFIMHDLRNVAATLNLLAQNAKSHLDNKHFRSDYLTALMRTASEMQRLIDRLAMVKAGNDVQDWELCSPPALVYEVLDALPMPANIDLKVDMSLASNAVWVKDQIRTMLRNLVLNGIEAMPRGGKLCIQATEDESQVHFSVSDTGAGMTQEFIRQRLFKPHQTTKSKGLGIGLYQSREMIAAHRGRIMVNSQLNKGTCFDVFLPLCPADANAPEALVVPAEAALPAKKASDFEWTKLKAVSIV